MTEKIKVRTYKDEYNDRERISLATITASPVPPTGATEINIDCEQGDRRAFDYSYWRTVDGDLIAVPDLATAYGNGDGATILKGDKDFGLHVYNGVLAKWDGPDVDYALDTPENRADMLASLPPTVNETVADKYNESYVTWEAWRYEDKTRRLHRDSAEYLGDMADLRSIGNLLVEYTMAITIEEYNSRLGSPGAEMESDDPENEYVLIIIVKGYWSR